MKGILSVFSFTFREQARKKSFIVSTVIIYALIILVICVPAIINAVQSASGGNSSKTTNSIFIVDSDKIVSNNINEFSSLIGGYKFEVKQPSDIESLKNSIKENSNQSLIVLSLKNGAPTFDLYVKNMTDGPDGDKLSQAVKKVYGETVLKQSGTSQQIIDKAYSDVIYNSTTLGRGTVSGMISSYAVIIILFMAIYMYGYWVAMSIASEKTSRVMEVLITSTKPSRIVIGKSLGMGVLGLCQLLGVIIIGGAVYFVAYPQNFQIGGTAINLSGFSPLVLFMIIVYFIFGFALFAMMNAVCGATVSKSEDIQQAIMPVTLISIISFYFSYSTMLMPDSTASSAASLIPFSSPFAMPSRILTASVPAWQIILSLALLAATTALMGYISIRLYSSAVLHYGSRLKISELVKLSRNNKKANHSV
jgi:ABC-2 type transport system permease protein